MAPSDSQNHFDQAPTLNKEVHRHVQQRRRRWRGGGSVHPHLEVQQFDTFGSGAGKGKGKGNDYSTTPFLGGPSPCPFIWPLWPPTLLLNGRFRFAKVGDDLADMSLAVQALSPLTSPIL